MSLPGDRLKNRRTGRSSKLLKITQLEGSRAHVGNAGRHTPEPASSATCNDGPRPGEALKFTAPLGAQAQQAALGVLGTKPKVLPVGDDMGQ